MRKINSDRILLVDDEQELAQAMQIRLSSWGYDVSVANNGKEAINLLEKEVFEAVILDMMMPEMDGMETLKHIRSFNKTIKIIMLTAYGEEERFKKIKELNIAGFVYKGREFESVSELVHVALKGQK